MSRRHDDSIPGRALVLGLAAMISALPIATTIWAETTGTVEVGCEHQRPDEILSIICDRVVNEVRVLAADSGYRVVDVSGRTTEPSATDALRTIRVSLDATQPPGRFEIKTIDAKLTGSYEVQGAEPWTSELSAKGVPRDLVHPVADALVMRVSAFLASSPTE